MTALESGESDQEVEVAGLSTTSLSVRLGTGEDVLFHLLEGQWNINIKTIAMDKSDWSMDGFRSSKRPFVTLKSQKI